MEKGQLDFRRKEEASKTEGKEVEGHHEET